MTGASNRIYWAERPCPLTDVPDRGCEIGEMDHFGEPTGILYCAVHGEVLGWVGP